jgi:hypothetical protein
MLVDRDDTEKHVYYFSPAAAKLAMSLLTTYGAVQCAAPERSEVNICAAHQGLEFVPFA